MRPFVKEEVEEEAEEWGVKGLRCENGELLLARKDEAIKLIHRVGQSRESGRERVGEEDGELQWENVGHG